MFVKVICDNAGGGVLGHVTRSKRVYYKWSKAKTIPIGHAQENNRVEIAGNCQRVTGLSIPTCTITTTFCRQISPILEFKDSTARPTVAIPMIGVKSNNPNNILSAWRRIGIALECLNIFRDVS